MKLWIDDVRPAPEGYMWALSVADAKHIIKNAESFLKRGDKVFWEDEIGHQLPIALIDIDHDAGDYANYGGDYIKLLDWLEETGRNYPIRIHSMNQVGVANMRAIIERNGWTEVK